MKISSSFLCTFVLLPVALSACTSKPSPVTQSSLASATSSSDDVSVTTLTNPISPNLQAADATHGKVTGFSMGALAGENGTLANGAATAYYFEDKGTMMGIQLNIAAAKAGTYYAVTVVDPASGQKTPLGRLTNALNDVRYSLHFDTALDLQTDSTIIITLEQENEGSAAGQVVAKGVLKAIQR
jgi:hypothetical protein